MYQFKEFYDNSMEDVYVKTIHENTAWYYNGLSRSNGPAYVERRSELKIHLKRMSERTDWDECHVEWKTNGTFHRTDGPALYHFKRDNLKNVFYDFYTEWHCKNRKYNGTLHRFNGPAIHRFNNRKMSWMRNKNHTYIRYFLKGKKYSEYDYWATMLKEHPNKMPKVLSRTNKKITLDTDPKKPAPKYIYKKVKKLIWLYNFEKVPSAVYWTRVDYELRKKLIFK